MPGTILSALNVSIYLLLIIILKGRHFIIPTFYKGKPWHREVTKLAQDHTPH